VHTWSHKHATHVRVEKDVRKSNSMQWHGEGGVCSNWGREGERRATAAARPVTMWVVRCGDGGESVVASPVGGGDDTPS
jgi:hypothetical protein